MSNRILETIIRNRFQQLVLGCYIGTVMYSLFLMTAIRDIDNGVYVPALSTYLLILFATVDIFVFIYFLHFVTQYPKYQTIISHIHRVTLKQLKAVTGAEDFPTIHKGQNVKTLSSSQAGYFTGCDEKAMLAIQHPEGFSIRFLYPAGIYLLEGVSLLEVESATPLPPKAEALILKNIGWDSEVSDESYVTGFAHLSEVAIKALNPVINDPATAILSLHALADLFSYVLQHPLKSSVSTERIYVQYDLVSPEELMTRYLLPIWDYGKKDRSTQEKMETMVTQLLHTCERRKAHAFLQDLLVRVKKQKATIDEDV